MATLLRQEAGSSHFHQASAKQVLEIQSTAEHLKAPAV
jgi:hypothetical protein